MTSPAPSESSKAELRRDALARRDAIAAAERAAAAERVASRPFPVAVGDGACLSGFFPLRSEINPVPLMRRLADAGAKLALPVVVGRGRPLVFRAWSFGAPLGSGDLTLERLRAAKPVTAVGLAFAAQEIARVPATPRDEKLDLVLTEREVIDCRGT